MSRGALLDRASDAARPLHPGTGELDEIGDESRSRSGAGCVEQRAQKDQGHELPQLDADGRVQQRDRGDRGGAREVGDDTRRPEPEAIDDHAAKKPADDERQEVEEDGERGQRRAARRREHEPGDRELRDGVARERDDVGGVERVQR